MQRRALFNDSDNEVLISNDDALLLLQRIGVQSEVETTLLFLDVHIVDELVEDFRAVVYEVLVERLKIGGAVFHGYPLSGSESTGWYCSVALGSAEDFAS